MKRLYTWGSLVIAAVMSLTSCSSDDFPTLSAAGIPTASDYADKIEINVDQETNVVTFNLNAPGVMPVWIIDGTQYSTVNGLSKLYSVAGDYEVEMKVLNANGVSDGSVFKTFHIENSIVDYGRYTSILAGDGTREWRIDGDVQGHMGCGEPGTDGLNWWSANPQDKAAWGVYDNRLSFTKDYAYTFKAGDHGTIYVNKDVTRYAGYSGAEDFNVPAEDMTTTYSFEIKGTDLYLVLPKGTPFPYIPNDDFYDNPRLKVVNITPKALELIADNGGIAWHFILTSAAGAVTFNGFKYDSEFNLWKKATIEGFEFYYAPGWAQIADPETKISDDNKVLTVNLPSATFDRWQAQVKVNTDIKVEAAKTYDISAIVTVNQKGKVMFKMPKRDNGAVDDGVFLCAEEIAVEPFEEKIFYMTDIAGFDSNGLQLVLDFGGFPDGTEATISNIVVKDHACDDGTVLPDPSGPVEGEVVWAGVDDAANLMTTGNFGLASCWWANNDWGEITAPNVAINGRNATITVAEANGGNQWQGQVHLNTGVAIEEGKTYDFSITLTPTQDLSGATVKPHPEGDDGHFFSQDRHDLTAYEDNVVTITNFTADFSTENLVITLDFPGCQAGTVIEVKNIIIQEHNGAPAGPSWVGVDDAANLMTSGNFGLASCWWANNDWGEITAPNVAINGRNATITVAEANGGNQWQGQVHLNTGVAIEEGATYDFSITLTPTQDLGGATVKPHPEGDDGHFFSEARHDLVAYDDNLVTYTNFTADFSTANLVITLDFPGCQAGTVIEVKDIIIQKH